MRKLLLILMMVIAGAALSLAFPRTSLWPIAWVGLVPLLILVRDSRPRTAALAGFAFGIGFFGALENRRFVVRSAASGVSSIIDPYGRIQESLGMWKRGVIYGEIEMHDGLTIYTRFGDWFLYLCIAITACGVGSGITAQRKKKLDRV